MLGYGCHKGAPINPCIEALKNFNTPLANEDQNWIAAMPGDIFHMDRCDDCKREFGHQEFIGDDGIYSTGGNTSIQSPVPVLTLDDVLKKGDYFNHLVAIVRFEGTAELEKQVPEAVEYYKSLGIEM